MLRKTTLAFVASTSFFSQAFTLPATLTSSSSIKCPRDNGTSYAYGNKIFVVECGIDRYDNDQSMVYTQSLQDCMAKCGGTQRCLDVSWVPGRPGPCYMKSDYGAIQHDAGIWGARMTYASALDVPCPWRNQTTYADPNGREWLLECDVDHFDSDFLTNPTYVDDLEECIDACNDEKGCTDVILSGEACYLKHTAGPSIYRPGSGLAGAICISNCSATSSSATTTASTITIWATPTASDSTISTSTRPKVITATITISATPTASPFTTAKPIKPRAAQPHCPDDAGQAFAAHNGFTYTMYCDDGPAKPGNVISSWNEDSPEACMDRCPHIHGCKAATFDQRVGKCFLYDKNYPS